MTKPNPAEDPRKPGPESTLATVRAELIDQAMILLRQRGADLTLSAVPLRDVIGEAGVSRTTAYRSLAHDDLAPQEVLHRELLTKLLNRSTRDKNYSMAVEAVAAELELHEDVVASGDVRERTRVVRNLIRAGLNATYYEVAGSVDRSVLMASYGSLRSLQSSSPDDWRHEEVVAGERDLARLFGDMYLGLSTLFRQRLRPEFTILEFSTAVAAFVEGIAMRHGISDHVEGIARATGPTGEIEDWTLCAVGFEGLYMLFFEPEDPDDPFADLRRY